VAASQCHVVGQHDLCRNVRFGPSRRGRIGRIIIGMMTKGGKYPVAYAAAITASAAIIGPIIPPSISMVLLCLISDTRSATCSRRVRAGVMLGLAFMVMNSIIARRKGFPVEPASGPRDAEDHAAGFPRADAAGDLLFGIYGGVMTPTRGRRGCGFYALFASTVLYRAVTWKQLYDAILTSGKASTSWAC